MNTLITKQNYQSLQSRHIISNEKRRIFDFCISSDSSSIAALEFRTDNEDTQDLNVRIWNTDGRLVGQSPSGYKWLHMGRIQFIDNSKILVSGENYKASPFTNHLKIWQVETNRWTFLLDYEFADTHDFQISPNKDWLALIYGGRNVPRGFLVIKMPHTAMDILNKQAVGSDFSFGSNYDYGIREFLCTSEQLDIKFRGGADFENLPSITYSPNSRYICWDTGGKSFMFLDTQTWSTKELFQHPIGLYPICGFSHDSKRLFVRKLFDREISVWDVETAQKIYEIGAWGHNEEQKLLHSEVMTMVSSPKTPLIVFGHKDGSISLWNSEKFQCLGQYQAHQNAIFRTYFNDSGNALFTSDGNTIVKWVVV